MVRSFTSSPTPQAGLLFGLPLELRLLIYRLLLVSYLPIPIEYDRLPSSGSKPTPMKSPIPASSAALLVVCQDIHIEAEAILYASNQFAFRFTSDELPLFLTSISLHAYELVAGIVLCWPSSTKPAKEAVDLLTGCRGLKRLCIQRLYKPIPKYMIGLLEGLRLDSIDFYPQQLTENTNRLRKIVTDCECPRTRGQERRVKETRDDKVSVLDT